VAASVRQPRRDIRDINQCLVNFYNAVCLHSTLGYLLLAAYEAKTNSERIYLPV
jgi:putative transposase